jgi:type IV secretory pathway TrbD component
VEPTIIAYTAHEQRQLVAGIVAGVLIFVFPRLLNYIVAAYLVLIGIALIIVAMRQSSRLRAVHIRPTI